MFYVTEKGAGTADAVSPPFPIQLVLGSRSLLHEPGSSRVGEIQDAPGRTFFRDSQTQMHLVMQFCFAESGGTRSLSLEEEVLPPFLCRKDDTC